LARDFYLDGEIFEEDLHRVFRTSWLFAGHSCEISRSGDYFTFEVGDESLVILRDKADDVRAFFNVCRHRGSKLATSPCGHAKALVCPYHQWVYALDGSLVNARLMGDDFDPDKYQLRSAEVREVAGLIFVCLTPDETTPDFDHFFQALEPQLKPHGLERSKIIARHHYEVKANWKTLIENNRECYHCRVSHPEFCMSNYDLGLPGDTRSDAGYDAVLDNEYYRWRGLGLSPREISFPNGKPYRISRLPLKEGYITESLDGSRVAPLMGDLNDENAGSLRIITLPNFWAHANCDYAMTTRLTPVNASLTKVEVTFLVDQTAVEGEDYDPQEVAHVWKATSEQDWELCENNYAGIKSIAYEPGPFSELTEGSVESFLQWYLDLVADEQSVFQAQPYEFSASA
jgi:Rieske 2Fe-2S family protein